MLLSSCATVPTEETGSVATAAATALEELPAQTLGSGQCALILWSNPAQPKRIAMTVDEPAIARIQIDGRLLQLPRVSARGEAIHGMFPEQTYRGEGISLAVSFGAEPRELTAGAVIPTAVVEYTDASGWAAVIPAAGMIACR
jgi:hypothetical protein